MDRHEDNTQFENFLQKNSQNLVENLQQQQQQQQQVGIAGGVVCGVGVGENLTGDEINNKLEHSGDLGCFEDDNEWKYIKEEQQSEKQQQQQGAGVGNGNDFVFGGNHDGDFLTTTTTTTTITTHHPFGNGDVNTIFGITGNGNENAGIQLSSVGRFDEENLNNDGDFSTTSNTTSTPGEGEPIVDLLKIDGQQQPEKDGQQQKETEEDDGNSLATNSTNRTSSLSDNPSAPADPENPFTFDAEQQLQEQQQEALNVISNSHFDYDKENINPKNVFGDDGSVLLPTRPTDFDTELHSQLNPNAMEFVPSHGSNTASPTSPPIDDANISFDAINTTPKQQLNVAVHDDGEPIGLPHLKAVHQHLLAGDDDDFIAESPRKGRCANMDEVLLPAENEFENEVAKRPHELEQEDDDLIGDGALQLQDLPLEVTKQQQQHHEPTSSNDEKQFAENLLQNINDNTQDCLDFQLQMEHTQTNGSFIDHGPETSVDLDASELVITQQKSDVTGADIPIEDILNTVQPLPNDIESLDNSFNDDNNEPHQQHASINEKELLCMNTVGHMQDSFYIENTSTNDVDNQLDFDHQIVQQLEQDLETGGQSQTEQPTTTTGVAALATFDDSVLNDSAFSHAAADNDEGNISILSDNNSPFGNTTLDETTIIGANVDIDNVGVDLTVVGGSAVATIDEQEIFQSNIPTDFTQEFKADAGDTNNTPSPYSTVEKHLMEETKEQWVSDEPQQHDEFQQQQFEDDTNTTSGELEQKMKDLTLSEDGNLQKVEDVAHFATTITQNENPISNQSHVDDIEFQFNELKVDENFTAAPIAAFADAVAPSIEAASARLEAEMNAISEDDMTPKITPEREPEPIITAEIKQEEIVAPSSPTPAPASIENEVVATEIPIAVEVEAEVAPTEALAPIETAVPAAAPTADDESSSPVSDAVVAAFATGTAAIAAAAGAVATGAKKAAESVGLKKATTSKSTTSTLAAKPKVSDVKKPATDSKKPTATAAAKTTSTTSSLSARPRTAPAAAKPASVIEKKTTTAAKPAALAAKKPATTTSAAAPATRTATKTTATTTTARPASTRPATAPRVAATRVSGASTTLASRPKPTTTTNGSTAPAAKPRTPTTAAAAAPTKPTTLGISATAKPKLSPRSTLTSQLRKTGGPPTSTTAARSPTKAAPATNGLAAKTTTSNTSANRARPAAGVTGTATTTTTTKTFTARPAPKTTSSTTTTTTTTRRITTTTAGSTTGAAGAPKKLYVSPLKPATKLTTTKSPANLKPKTKEVASKLKTTPETLKPKSVTPKQQLKVETTTTTTTIKTNGVNNGAGGEPQLNGIVADITPPQENGNTQNGDINNGADVGVGLEQQPAEIALIDA